MVTFQVESWAAMAPSLEQKQDWRNWLADPKAIDESLGKISPKQIPPLLRRRFNMLGKCAIGAVLQVLKEEEAIPSIFASRHGDIVLTHAVLEDMGRDEPMSPTSFSLAVHNAVSGLYSIARKDTSAVTAIAAMNGLVLNALLEAIGQLQVSDRVLCVIYDAPLPELYRRYSVSEPFPHAIAMILNNNHGESYTLEQTKRSERSNSLTSRHDSESLQFLELLSGLSSNIEVELNDTIWTIKKVKS